MTDLRLFKAIFQKLFHIKLLFRSLHHVQRGAGAQVLGVNTVQQSSYGSMEISYVSMRCASVTISDLSLPISGRKTGIFAAASVQAMACIVWLATCQGSHP